MPNFQDTFETRKRSFSTAFAIYMTVPLRLVLYSAVIHKRRRKKLISKTLKYDLDSSSKM